MEHTKAILYKFIMITAVLLLILGFIYGVDFGDIFVISLLLTVTAYILGDLLILPNFGNVAATLSDFGLALFGIWLLGNMFIDDPMRIGVASFLSAILITVGEWFFHRYLTKDVLKETNRNRHQQYGKNPTYQSEFAEEQTPNTESFVRAGSDNASGTGFEDDIEKINAVENVHTPETMDANEPGLMDNAGTAGNEEIQSVGGSDQTGGKSDLILQGNKENETNMKKRNKKG